MMPFNNTTETVKVFIENNEVPWEDMGSGIRRKIMAYDDNLMLVAVEFQKGAIGSIHQHYHTQITHLHSGKFEVQISGQKKELATGDVFYVPPHAPHGVLCLEAGVLVDVFSPKREDFINSSNRPG
jgi:quercetin dioxygenase-like cupin family protein